MKDEHFFFGIPVKRILGKRKGKDGQCRTKMSDIKHLQHDASMRAVAGSYEN